MADTNVTPTADDQPQPSPGNQDQGASVSQSSQEELEWQKLKGSTQQRFRQTFQKVGELSRENEELRIRLEALENSREQQPYYPPPPPVPQPNSITDEQAQAVNTIRSKYGFTTKDDVKAEMDKVLTVIQQSKNEEIVDKEYERLESTYDGSDGRPAFDRVEIEDYMRRNAIYQPEVAYKALYEEELTDWEVARRTGKQPEDDTKPYSEKPKHRDSSGSKPLSMDQIQQRLREPGGREWWEKNRETILNTMPDLLK